MWTRLVSTRPVSDQKHNYSVVVSFARKHSNFREKYFQLDTHVGSPWLRGNGQGSAAETCNLSCAPALHTALVWLECQRVSW